MDAKRYDVFISYRRAEALEWVRSNLFEPLQLCTNREGAAPEVFFDMSEIKPGQQYLTVLSEGILNARNFVPVYSPTYFDSEFCGWEISRAFELDPMGKRRFLVPLLLQDDVESKIAFSYRGIQFIRVSDPNWFSDLCSNLGLTPPGEAASGDQEVRVWVEPAHLPRANTRKIRLIPRVGDGAHFRLGDHIRIGFQSSFDAFVTLIDVSTDGEREVIWPHSQDQNNRCKQGVAHYVPTQQDNFALQLEGSSGTERVVAVACATREQSAAVPELLRSGALDDLLAPRRRKIAVVPRTGLVTASCGFVINAGAPDPGPGTKEAAP